MKKMLVLLLCLWLCGCATTAKYEAKLNTWIGTNEGSLVAAWGVPDKEYRMIDGKKAIEYMNKKTIQTGGYTYRVPQTTYHTGTIGNQTYSGTSTEYATETAPVQKHRLFCKTSFILDTSGKIISWHHEGNNCVSP